MTMDVQFDEVFEHVMMNAIIAACNGDGVLDGLTVSERGAGANMSVDVAAGNAWIGGTKYTESSTVNLAISAADATYDRKDLVTYDSNTSNPIVTTGTAAPTPEPPDIPSGNVLLAIVDVAAGTTQILDENITDGVVILPSFDNVPDGSTYLKFLATERSKLAGIEDNANNYTHPGTIQCNANNYTHPSSRQCTSGSWAWGSISGKPSTYPPSSHTHGGGDITSQVSDSDKVDGCDAGTLNGMVFKLPTLSAGYIYYTTGSGIMGLAPSTDGYQLTTHGASAPSWSAASDLIFSDTHCPKCNKKFETGDTLVLYVVGHNEVGDTLTIPMHKDCAEAPKKTVTIKRKVFEDRHVLDELTGETKIQRVQKTQKKTVTKHKLKEGYELDHRTGKAIKINEDGSKDETQHDLSIALETVEETIDEPVYEDVEYEI